MYVHDWFFFSFSRSVKAVRQYNSARALFDSISDCLVRCFARSAKVVARVTSSLTSKPWFPTQLYAEERMKNNYFE